MNNSTKVIEFLVSSEEEGFRVDKALSLYDRTLSRSYLKKLILNGSLYINNIRIVDPSYKLIKANAVKIVLPELIDDKPKPENIPLEILYEDDFLLVINII